MMRTHNGPGAYRDLARYYEILNSDCDYDKWSQYLLSLLEESGAGRTGADVGCGNGRMTCRIARAGYSLTAFDPSPDMLAEALAYAPKAACRIPFVLGGLDSFRLPGKVDFVLSVNDCVNYIAPDRLEKSFRNVAANLKKDGVFLFDVSSPAKLRAMDEQLYFDDEEEIFCFWQNRLQGDSLRMELTFFAREGELYRRFDEVHVQYLHAVPLLEAQLKKAGFGRIDAYQAFTREPADERCDRIQLRARKN